MVGGAHPTALADPPERHAPRLQVPDQIGRQIRFHLFPLFVQRIAPERILVGRMPAVLA
jgi:hypothetical protein